MNPTITAIVDWLRQRTNAAGTRGFAVGLSGGVDSAVVARLCELATPGQVAGLIMPCGSDPRDEADARLVADQFGIAVVTIDLEPAYDAVVRELGAAIDQLPSEISSPARRSSDAARVPLANVRARLRMTSLYFVANSLNYLVAGTGNRSELTIGYFTKHGDGGVDVLPIGHLFKSDVRQLAKDLAIPPSIIDKAPSAGLWQGQTDEMEMGFSYADLENYLSSGPEGVSPALALRLERSIRSSEHKRSMPPTPDS
ncbi:MAG TPA: NAD(+) synthase [Vicinamibacterales bacterium]|jgi:NAD+ synthase